MCCLGWMFHLQQISVCWGRDSFQYYILSIMHMPCIPQSAPSRTIVLISWEWTTSLQCGSDTWDSSIKVLTFKFTYSICCGLSISVGFGSRIGMGVVCMQCYLSCYQIAILSSIVWPHKTRTAYKAGIKWLFWLILTHKNSWLPLYLSIAFR